MTEETQEKHGQESGRKKNAADEEWFGTAEPTKRNKFKSLMEMLE